MDADSTLALLSAPLPDVPNYPTHSDSEDEVFFGERSDKEANGKNVK